MADPMDYTDTLTLWLGEQEGCLPILMTGVGTRFIYRRRSETTDDMCLLDIHYHRSGSFAASFSDFFERILPSEQFAEQVLRTELFREATAKYGSLAAGEILFFSPALALGGEESLPHVKKGDAAVHQHLLFELGADHFADAEPGDAWSQVYEVNPHAFELEGGGLMVSFTLSETADTILPAEPEALYEMEEKTSSLWALTFFSLTKDEILGYLEYHRVLQRLRPYILETRDGHILLRGLSLKEMELVLSAQ